MLAAKFTSGEGARFSVPASSRNQGTR